MDIKLNCDMGEGFGLWKMGLDKEIMPYIDLANLACGFHASDALTMNHSVELATKHNVLIGAHPGYQDIVGFGRRSMVCTRDEIRSLVLYQMGALNAFCKANNSSISYVKPHGALYNDMMKDETIFIAILEAISVYDKNIKLMTLSNKNNEKYQTIAKRFGINLLYEVFADRNYTDEGFLVSRNHNNAVIHNDAEVSSRVQTLKNEGYIRSVNNQKLFLTADTICVHGDNEKALEFIKLLKKVLS